MVDGVPSTTSNAQTTDELDQQIVMCGPSLGCDLAGSGLLKLKPNPELRVRLGLGLVRLEPRLHI
jgi:hypothetical protein